MGTTPVAAHHAAPGELVFASAAARLLHLPKQLDVDRSGQIEDGLGREDRVVARASSRKWRAARNHLVVGERGLLAIELSPKLGLGLCHQAGPSGSAQEVIERGQRHFAIGARVSSSGSPARLAAFLELLA
jgi:hypothetical protein